MSKGLFKTNFKHSPIVVLYAHRIFTTSHDLANHDSYNRKVTIFRKRY